MQRLNAAILILVFLSLQRVATQPLVHSSFPDNAMQAANPHLQASGLHRFFFGSLWRDTWATPVQWEILNPDSSTGGFTFDSILSRTHQGVVTHSYSFKSTGRNDYVFTPFNQDSGSSLPYELTILLPQDIVEDQMGTLNPYAPLVVAPILQALDLPYRETQLVILPRDSSLANYGIQTKGQVGILEGPLHIPLAGAKPLPDDLAETPQMLESLESDLHYRVDELQYLKERLTDILLGDWDRPADQWKWLKVQTSHITFWKAVPITHRQAFVRLNGLLPTIADLAVPQLEHCGTNITNIENLTLTGCSLDRRLLISYPKQTWDSLSYWIQNQLSDSIILLAVSRLPVPIFEREGQYLLRLLQARRAQMPKAADEFYKLLSAYMEIHCSNKADRAEIRRIGRHMVSVSLFDRSDTLSAPIYQRLFHDDFTKEIRLLLLDGNDCAVIEGEESSTIKIIVDGGAGQNEIVDRSKSRSIFSSLNPFSSSGTSFYDYNPASHIVVNSRTDVIREWPMRPAAEKENQGRVNFRDWGSEWSFSPWLDINPDDGLFIGGGPMYTQYGYRKDPFAEQIEVRAGLAMQTRRYRLDATGEFRDWFRRIHAFIQLHASQLDISNYFGPGNETRYNQSLDNAGVYKVDQRQIFLLTALDFPITADVTAAIGSTIKLIDSNPNRGTLLSTLMLPYYNKSLTLLILSSQIQTDTRNDKWLPLRGLYAKAEVFYHPDVLDNKTTFFNFRSEVRTYYTPQAIGLMTIAVRAAGEKIWGNHPFFESAFLGGNESLRGFERQRFAGDASILGGVELRVRIAHIPFIVPLWAGLSGFAETGRVFLDSEQSDRWHNVIGGGVWFSLIKPEYVVNFSIARSEDKFAFYATMGFIF